MNPGVEHAVGRLYEVEAILQQSGDGTMLQVKWVGYPASWNDWLARDDLVLFAKEMVIDFEHQCERTPSPIQPPGQPLPQEPIKGRSAQVKHPQGEVQPMEMWTTGDLGKESEEVVHSLGNAPPPAGPASGGGTA